MCYKLDAAGSGPAELPRVKPVSMKYSKIITPLAIIAVAALLAVAFVLSRPEPKIVDNKPAPLLVDAIEAVKEDIQVSVRTQGTVVPRTETTLVAEVSGRIVEVADHFSVGGYFRKGDVLLGIDQRDYVAAVKRAEANLASARSQLASEKGRAEVAYQDWVKYRSTVKRSEAATDLALRKPQLEEAQAGLDSAMAELEHARVQLDRTKIRAPYDGLFAAKRVDIGQYVNAGTPLADIFAIDRAELRMALPEHKLNYLELPTLAQPDLSIEPRVDLFAEVGEELQSWQARLVRTEGVFDDRTRVLFAVAEIIDPYGIHQQRTEELRIGTFVEARIQGRVINDLVVLPRQLLRAGNRVWIIDQQNRLQNRKVSVLRTDGAEIYVTMGLDQGELVCASTITGAVPGTLVRIANTTPSNKDRAVPEPEAPQQGESGDINLAPASEQNQDDPAQADKHEDQPA